MSAAALPTGAHSINGVSGSWSRHNTRSADGATLKRQEWHSVLRKYDARESVRVTIRHDDSCGNGHPSFAVMANSFETLTGREGSFGGCCHDVVAQVFPELAPLIKWHLCSTDGPMHYPGNVVYHAGDRDHWGLRAGEYRQVVNGRTGLPAWHLCVDDGSALGQPLHSFKPTQHDGMAPPLDVPRLAWRP